MTRTDVEVAVVGGGAAGLAAGLELARAGRSFVVLEAGERAGGVATTVERDGFRFERGPNTFRVPGAMAELLRRADIESVLVPAKPIGRERFLLRDGALIPVPLGPGALASSPLLSRQGKLRLLREPFVRGGDGRGESVAEFVERRLGREAVDALVGPFLTGVYAGDETQLGAQAVFPSLVEAERRGRSIAVGSLLGVLRRNGEPPGLAGTWSAMGGIGGLVDACAAILGDSLLLGSRVCEVAFDEGVHRLEIETKSPDLGGAPGGSRTLRAAQLLLATPAAAASKLLQPVCPNAAESLDAILYAPVASLSFGVAAESVGKPIRGFGYLVPRGEGDVVLGCLFMSQLFAGRAPHGQELLTVLVGGVRRPEALDWPDDRLVAAVVEELDAALSLRDTPRLLGIARWPRAVPQPGRKHVRQVEWLRSSLPAEPPLALAGSHLDGVAFGQTIASGARAAASLLARLPARRAVAESSR